MKPDLGGTPNPFLRAALAYARKLGWPVFPLAPRTKVPLKGSHGHHDATTDAAQITAWWTQTPNANIGVATGVHFWVWDKDPRHNGDESERQLIYKHTALADTIQQITGSGGTQRFYTVPDGLKISTHIAVWSGIDVKGLGGYVLLPPSVHPSGGTYRWDTTKRSILEETINPADPWLIAEILEATKNRGQPGDPFSLPEKLKKGEQHVTLFKMGCAMRAKGCGEAEIFAALWVVNQERCERPGPRKNIEQLAASICKQFRPGDRNAGKEGATTESGALVTRCLADVEPEPTSWVWPERIPRGKLTTIAGDPGLGKSQVTASLASIVTIGGQWPVDGTAAAPGSVIFLTAEDGLEDTLLPRVIAAGADRSRIHHVEGVAVGYTGQGDERRRLFSLDKDIPALDRKLSEIGNVVLVVIDPLSAYLGRVDSHKDAEVRGLLAPLAEVAARHQVAIIGILHLNKAVKVKALLRIPGAIAFVAAGRANYVVTPDPNDKNRRLFLPLKCNLARPMPGLAYTIAGTIVTGINGPVKTSHILWDAQPVSITPDEAMDVDAATRASALAEAEEWLEEILASGPMLVKEVSSLAAAEGISKKTLRRAREALHIVCRKQPGPKGAWTWQRPNLPTLVNMQNMGNMGKLGKLNGQDSQDQFDQDAQDAQLFTHDRSGQLQDDGMAEEEI